MEKPIPKKVKAFVKAILHQILKCDIWYLVDSYGGIRTINHYDHLGRCCPLEATAYSLLKEGEELKSCTSTKSGRVFVGFTVGECTLRILNEMGMQYNLQAQRAMYYITDASDDIKYEDMIEFTPRTRAFTKAIRKIIMRKVACSI